MTPCRDDFEAILEDEPNRVHLCTVFTAPAAISGMEEKRGDTWNLVSTQVCPTLGMPHKHHVLARQWHRRSR